MAAAGAGATALACAGLALLSTPSQAAAPAQAAAPEKHSYAGAPLNPAPYTVTQPDGTTLRVHNFGDRLSHGVATVKGDNSLVKGKDGFWRYAAGLTSSGDLKASSVVAGQGKAPRASQDLAPTPEASPTPPKAPLGGVGDDHELVILVDFADQAPVGTTQEDWADRYFGTSDSVDDFYEEASKGQFGLTPVHDTDGDDNGVVGWLDLPYDHPNTGVDGNATDDYVADAIKAAEPYVDFASYDANSDGQLTTDELHVTVIGAGDETSYAGPGNTCDDAPSIWGHEWDLASAGVAVPTVDGVKLGRSGYTTFGEWHCAADEPAGSGHMATIGIMAHEFGHDINWPDLYDIDNSGEGIGEWSLMAGGSWNGYQIGLLPGQRPSHPDAWALYYQHWLTPQSITTATDNVRVPVGGAVLMSPNPGGTDWLFNQHSGTGEYFLVENRERLGYDGSLPGCGLVVYRVDETVSGANDANADALDPLVKVVQADGQEDLENGQNRGDVGDPYPGYARNRDLTDATTPNAHFDTGAPSGLQMHVDLNGLDAEGCAPTMQIDVKPGVQSPAITAPANDNFANATVISGNTGTVRQSTKGATEQTDEPVPAGCGVPSVWYRWTAPSNGNLTLSTAGSGYDTVLGLYTGSAVTALTELAANDDENHNAGILTSKVVKAVTAGTTYQVAADGCAGSTGRLVFSWSFDGPPAPKLATTTTASAPKTVKFKKDFDVTANVTPGATGTVTVTDGSKVLGTGTLSNGTVKVHVTRNLKPGKHTLTVAYGGSDSALASSTTVTVKVTQKKKHHRH
ncbi:MAG TPA: M6 family metalloprotease domain-containing protein [Nocardioides sp.]|nr:M6 family metalloprotease domain-containing protein [Nocardioides sp.]